MRCAPAAAVALAAMLVSGVSIAESLDPDVLATQAVQRPKWEAGVAGVALTVPNYPAADEYQTLVLPAPYFVYRGRTLKADREGSRLRRALTPNAELSFSGGGALASNSGDTDAREGMPDLGYMLELGPNLGLSYAGLSPGAKFLIDFPLRGVVSLDDSHLNWRGVVFSPRLAYQSQGFLRDRLRLRPSIGVEIASTALQRYFYEVQPAFATPLRPAYSASAGYLGSSLGLLTTYALTPRVQLFLALNYNNHAGAANDDSPLFRTNHTYSAVTGFSWSLFQSRQMTDQ